MAVRNQRAFRSGRFAKHAGLACVALALAWLGAACSGGGSASLGVTSPRIRFTGPSTWTITGPEGGPFANGSLDVQLQNTGADPIDWSASSVPSYVLLDLTSGTIAANSSTTVHAALDSALAATLSAGNNAGVLAFHNDTAPQPDISITTSLSISAPGVSIFLGPATNFTTSGPAGGPFVPPSTIYSLTNTGSAVLSWRVNVGATWVSASPGSGQLAPNATVDVSVAISDPATSSMSSGVYWSYIDFVDATSNTTVDTRNVGLTVTVGAPSVGWTVFTPSVDTRTVYVSSSQGNDANDGLSTGTPKRTIAAGKSLLRNGYPDWLLLKKGDTWDESLGTWSVSGRSLSERMLVSSYGTSTARPLLRTGLENGVALGAVATNNVAFVGIHLWANLFNGSQGQPKGVNWLNGTANLLIEDCFIEGYETNVVVMGYPTPLRHTNVSIRRNVIVDAYNTGTSNSEGLYLADCDGLLLEENVLDRNGWNLNVPGSVPTWYRRNVYMQTGSTGVTVHGNIVAGTDGTMERSGGNITDNLFLKNAIAIEFGGGNFPELAGVRGTIADNVFLDGGDIGTNGPSQGPRGWAIAMENVAQVLIQRNVMAHNTSGHDPIGMRFSYANGWSGNVRGVENANVVNNICYDWGGAFQFRGSLAQTVNIQLNNLKIHNTVDAQPLISHNDPTNTAGVFSSGGAFYSSMRGPGSCMMTNGSYISLSSWKSLVHDTTSVGTAAQYPDPTRTIETYHASIGGAATFDAFMAGARQQSKANWRPEYTSYAVNNYVRAGFGL